MRLTPITSTYSVADQITEQDVQQLAAAGVKTIIGNRPDREGGTPLARIEAACAHHGVAFFAQPVEFAGLGPAEADQFGRILQQAPAPAVGYCRSGRRSAALWALANAPLAGVAAVLARCARAGIDLAELRPQLELVAARGEPAYASNTDAAARRRYIERWLSDLSGDTAAS